MPTLVQYIAVCTAAFMLLSCSDNGLAICLHTATRHLYAHKYRLLLLRLSAVLACTLQCLVFNLHLLWYAWFECSYAYYSFPLLL